MPYYNQLYASAKLEFDPFIDTDITSDGDRNKWNTADRSIDGNNTSHENTHKEYVVASKFRGEN